MSLVIFAVALAPVVALCLSLGANSILKHNTRRAFALGIGALVADAISFAIYYYLRFTLSGGNAFAAKVLPILAIYALGAILGAALIAVAATKTVAAKKGGAGL